MRFMGSESNVSSEQRLANRRLGTWFCFRGERPHVVTLESKCVRSVGGQISLKRALGIAVSIGYIKALYDVTRDERSNR